MQHLYLTMTTIQALWLPVTFVMGLSILNLIIDASHVEKKLLSIQLKLQTTYQVCTP